jgi:pimeloyl-ACP methyl ester carboxylesterase
MEEHRITINGMEMNYVKSGVGPPLVLLHSGFSCGSFFWKDYFEELSKFYTVYAPDTRGHGKSTNPDDIWSYSQYAEDIAAFIQVLDLEMPFICGWSDGGQIALELSYKYPELPLKVIIGGTWIDDGTVDWESLNQLGFENTGEVDFDVLKVIAPKLVDELKLMHSSQGDDYWKVVVKNDVKVFSTLKEYSEDDLNQIVAPMLIVLGDRDQYLPVSEAVKMYKKIQGSSLAVVPDATHALLISHRDFFMELIKYYLR